MTQKRYPLPFQTQSQGQGQFKQLEARTLFCSDCRMEQPVRKKLLIILPGEERYDYCCTVCGKTVGGKIEPQRPENFLILGR